MVDAMHVPLQYIFMSKAPEDTEIQEKLRKKETGERIDKIFHISRLSWWDLKESCSDFFSSDG
jgi:hypothetical protein